MHKTWGASKQSGSIDDVSASAIRMMDEGSKKKIFFDALRAGNVGTIRSVLQVDRTLLNAKFHGFEGSDVYDTIKSKSKRCYNYTGLEKDGFFYPLHVASESGHKTLVMQLIKVGADANLTDYRGDVAEQKCNGEAINAFYELRGLKFESIERYEGVLDRNGKRSGQGILCFKPEGYLSAELPLYRGGFKNDAYDGHGTLYWVGTEITEYSGRFKGGKKHGRGVQFDKQGSCIYKGTFRDDTREGRGEEFADGQLTYKGEFANNMRQGFGVAYFGEGHKYIGCFDQNSQSGLGVYMNPNGDRYEGMFFKNRPHGPGSYYKVASGTGGGGGGEGDESAGSRMMIDGTVYNVQSSTWQNGRATKDLPGPFEPTPLDMPLKKESILANLETAVAADEVLGTSMGDKLSASGPSQSRQTPAAKVFEGRLAATDKHRGAPDFECVQHLVIDAVEAYNSRWEEACIAQQAAAEQRKAEEEAIKKQGKVVPAVKLPGAVETKRHLFMSEKEKEIEGRNKQRLQQAAKLGSMELNPDTERQLAEEIVDGLEQDLLTLVEDPGAWMPVAADESVNEGGSSGSTGGSSGAGGAGVTDAVPGLKTISLSDSVEDLSLLDMSVGDVNLVPVLDNEISPQDAIEAEVQRSLLSAQEANGDFDSSAVPENEFAIELLYLLRMSKSMLGPQSVDSIFQRGS